MHAALKRLFDADVEVERAERALEAAQNQRYECAVALSEIDDPDERLQAVVFANQRLKGLSVALAQAVTGLPGKKGQSKFPQLAGRIPPSEPKLKTRRKNSSSDAVVARSMKEWPIPSGEKVDVIRAYIQHGKFYNLYTGLGWTSIHVALSPVEAVAYLEDPSGALARKFGVSRDEFCEWFGTDGSVACNGTLVKGGRCQILIGSQLPIKVWKEVKDQGGYCKRHREQAQGG